MTAFEHAEYKSHLLMVAGAKGAVGSTLAVAVAILRHHPESILPWLTTGNLFSHLNFLHNTHMVGWDKQDYSLLDAIVTHQVLPEHLWKPLGTELQRFHILDAPSPILNLEQQVIRLSSDITSFKTLYPESLPVFINLLPATLQMDLSRYRNFQQLYGAKDSMVPSIFPDLAYVLAAIISGVPVVNFTPNTVEIPAVISESVNHRIPIAGRDGKTGQTYLKMVLASALKARNLYIDGWYSLNLLGNKDGENLMDPGKAASKVAHKTELLDDILGYAVGEKYQTTTHKVRIDYYPPRGDAKEAWDVIDFQGLFGLPMSLRLNLQARDSVLAAPMVLDLSRWMAALQFAKRYGPIPELAFYFKKPIGETPPINFQEQIAALKMLEKNCC